MLKHAAMFSIIFLLASGLYAQSSPYKKLLYEHDLKSEVNNEFVEIINKDGIFDQKDGWWGRRGNSKLVIKFADRLPQVGSIEFTMFGFVPTVHIYDVEHAFRSLKTTLKLRPNYHSKDERIKCHIFLCFLSLLLIRVIENETEQTWSKVRDEMSRLYFGEFDQNGSKVRLLTELTRDQKTILKTLNIKEPSTVVDIQP